MILLLLAAACRWQETTGTQLAIPTVAATAHAPVALQNVNNPSGEATSIRLAPTFTPIPTLTPKSLSTAVPTSVQLDGPEDFGLDRNPLTGELVEDLLLLERRPIAVKISNSPARWVRPQSGLSQADLVFEHVTEGSITRFTAIFYGRTPENLGPIRSARLLDLEIPTMYDSALAFSGSSIGVSRKLFNSDFRSRILRPHESGYYRTGENKPYEHTLYARPSSLWQTLQNKGENHRPEFLNYMTFATETPAGGQPASAVNVKYRDFTSIDWRYDASTGRYYRWADGQKHTDANNGQQISAANLILLFADHTLDRSICEFQSGDQCLAFSTEIDLFGEGATIIVRDGLKYEATWKRSFRSEMLTFVDRIGNPFPLQIGNTWIQVIPVSYDEPVTISP